MKETTAPDDHVLAGSWRAGEWGQIQGSAGVVSAEVVAVMQQIQQEILCSIFIPPEKLN